MHYGQLFAIISGILLISSPLLHAEEIMLRNTITDPAVQPETVLDTPGSEAILKEAFSSTEFLMQSSPMSQTSEEDKDLKTADGYFSGIQNGATVNGTLQVRLREDTDFSAKKVAWYLNGTKAGKEYTPPFTWGGTDGFDTRTLSDGDYTLSGYITTYEGDRLFSYDFSVNNTAVSPEPDPDPEPSPDPDLDPEPLPDEDTPPSNSDTLGITAGETVSGTVLFRPDPEHFSGIRKAAYYLNGTKAGKVYSSPFTWGGDSGFNTGTLPDGTYTLSGYVTTDAGDQAFESVTFHVDNTGDGQPQDPGTDPEPGQDPEDPNVEHRASVEMLERDGTWGYTPADPVELGQQMGLDVTYQDFDRLYAMARQSEGTQAGDEFFALYEPYYMAYKSGENTVIAISTSERDRFRYGCDNGCAELVEDTGRYTILVLRTPAHPDGQVFEIREWITGGSGFGFSPDGELVVPGTWDSDTVLIYNAEGELIATADEAVPAGQNEPGEPEEEPEPEEDPSSPVTGIADGETVSGTVHFGPRTDLVPEIYKSAYYLNGTKAGKVYSPPFTWGGENGFDTRTLANGTYTLSGYYTDASGDHTFPSVSFQVAN